MFACLLTTLGVQGAYIGAPNALQYPTAPFGYSGHYSPALVSQDANIIRSYGNMGQIATINKNILTPYSSVQKSEVRLSQDALAYPTVHQAASVPYVTPQLHHPASVAYASPPVHHARPVAYPVATPVKETVAPASFPAFHQPVHYPPATYQPYHQPYHQSYQQPYQQPYQPAASSAGLLGVVYSSAPVVSHMTYSNGYGVSYGY